MQFQPETDRCTCLLNWYKAGRSNSKVNQEKLGTLLAWYLLNHSILHVHAKCYVTQVQLILQASHNAVLPSPLTGARSLSETQAELYCHQDERSYMALLPNLKVSIKASHPFHTVISGSKVGDITAATLLLFVTACIYSLCCYLVASCGQHQSTGLTPSEACPLQGMLG